MQIDTKIYGNRKSPGVARTGLQAAQVEETEQVAAEAEIDATVAGMQGSTKSQDQLVLSKTTEQSSNFEISTSKPSDNSRQLTQRLVAAAGQFEVRQVMTDAHSSLISLRVSAAMCKGEDAQTARACIRKLEKLIARANKKIENLNDEDAMKLKQAKAEKERKEELAREIKEELRQEYIKRKKREDGYLREAGQVDPGTEAKLEAQAQAMAAAQVQAESGTPGGSADTGGAFEGSSTSGGEPGAATAALAEVTIESGESV